MDDWQGKTFWFKLRIGPNPDKESQADAVQRVRAALKHLLRTWGIVNKGGPYLEDAMGLKQPKPARKK